MNDRITLASAALAALVAVSPAPAAATDIALRNAWMRPVRAGYPTAAVYVDITTDVALRLVGARTPIAKSVGIVLVDQNSDGTATDRPVKEADIPAGKETRFAYNGSRIELRELVENAPPGGNVPLTLDFVEAKGGKRHAIEIGVLVRGVMLPPPYDPAAPAADAPK